MTPSELLASLQPFEQRVVRLVYQDGCTQQQAARILAVERTVVATALALALRQIARRVLTEADDPGPGAAQLPDPPA